jgi:hypothetical protein
MEITELIKKFENKTLPRKEWNHMAHLEVILYYLVIEKDYYRALSKIRCGIIQYNITSEDKELCAKKYSETITVFWAKQVYQIFNFRRDGTFEELKRVILEHSHLCFSKYIFNFYSKEVLDSDRARAEFVEPDIKDLY